MDQQVIGSESSSSWPLSRVPIEITIKAPDEFEEQLLRVKRTLARLLQDVDMLIEATRQRKEK